MSGGYRLRGVSKTIEIGSEELAELRAENERQRETLAELLNNVLGRSPAGTVSVKAPRLTIAIRVMNLAGVEGLVRASGIYGQACVTCEGTGHMKDGKTAFDSETCMVCGGWGRVDLDAQRTK